MSMTDQPSTVGEATLAVALQDLRRITEVGLTQVSGQLALLVQRLDQADERSSHLNQRLDRTDARVDQLERSAVTIEQLNARTNRVYILLGLLVSALGVAAAVLGVWVGSR